MTLNIRLIKFSASVRQATGCTLLLLTWLEKLMARPSPVTSVTGFNPTRFIGIYGSMTRAFQGFKVYLSREDYEAQRRYIWQCTFLSEVGKIF